MTDAGGANIRAVGPDEPFTTAIDINDSGQVVGTVLNGPHTGYITGPDGAGYTFLGTLGGDETYVYGVNSAGQVIGRSTIAAGAPEENHAFITGPNGVGMTDLMLPGASYSTADKVNSQGEVTGTQWSANHRLRQQYVTGPNGTNVRLLGTLGDLPRGQSQAGGLNDKGWLVGASTVGRLASHIPVTLTGPDGLMRNLNDYIANLPPHVLLTTYAKINNHNQIAAQGSDGRCYIVCPNQDCKKSAD